ncbi:hypothetical protein [Mycoplasma wenyonii]|uniref:hypothetical protein n=1 Tax=Mycoplasma wenyonii TaxID=65123 RepID=UPI0011BD183D|nr:hypothetical protein [Mycoplasma wenyonii]
MTFGWKVDLNGEEKDQLLKRGPVTKEVQVFLRNDKGDNLWPKEWTGIRVLRNQYGGSLSVTYVHQKEQGAVGSILTFDRSSLETTKFICSWNELKKGREIELIRLGAQFGNYQYFRSGQEHKMSSNIRLDDCTNYKDGKKAECNLKVTTEGTDLDWSNKVTAKAKLSFE